MSTDPSLSAACGATLPDPVKQGHQHVCSRTDDHSRSPKGEHWDFLTDMTWPVASAAPKCPRCDYPVIGVEKRLGQPTLYRHAGGVHEDLTADMTVTAAPHPANCVGSYEDEPHIQDGGCMCDCPACTSGDHVQRCICPDCPGNPECGDHDDR